ncbi:hypothetical protein PR048_031583 [Dryococelus australis]|uniref:Uncharacterized protein n=1 Tax=Dryococelus australis TaxID=614101 RepID=A0ABQ9G5P7_9NEOP|nr:hypothetical protein PR048_031583 [Dryococelus australis]
MDDGLLPYKYCRGRVTSCLGDGYLSAGASKIRLWTSSLAGDSERKSLFPRNGRVIVAVFRTRHADSALHVSEARVCRVRAFWVAAGPGDVCRRRTRRIFGSRRGVQRSGLREIPRVILADPGSPDNSPAWDTDPNPLRIPKHPPPWHFLLMAGMCMEPEQRGLAKRENWLKSNPVWECSTEFFFPPAQIEEFLEDILKGKAGDASGMKLQRGNERAGKTGDLREKSPTNGIVRDLKCAGATVAERLAHSHPPMRSGFNPRPGHSGFSHVGIVPGDAVGQLVFSGFSRFPRPLIPRRNGVAVFFTWACPLSDWIREALGTVLVTGWLLYAENIPYCIGCWLASLPGCDWRMAYQHIAIREYSNMPVCTVTVRARCAFYNIQHPNRRLELLCCNPNALLEYPTRVAEVNMERRRNGRGKREIPDKTRRPTASSGTIPFCENPVTRPVIELGLPWWEARVLIAQPPWPLLVTYGKGSGFKGQSRSHMGKEDSVVGKLLRLAHLWVVKLQKVHPHADKATRFRLQL